MFNPYKAFGGAIAIAISGFLTMHAIKQQMTDVMTAATLLGRSSDCEVEYQVVGAAASTYKKLDCDAAAAFQRTIGENKVKLHRSDLVSFSYRSADGESRQATTAASYAPADLPVGGQFPITYDPARPEQPHQPVTFTLVGIALGMLAAGLFMVSARLGFNPLRVFRPAK